MSTKSQNSTSLKPSVVNIAVVNISINIIDEEVMKATADLQTQVTRDFYPIWELNVNLKFYDKIRVASVPKGHWLIIVSDNNEQAAALGYYDLTSEGKPLGKVIFNSGFSETSGLFLGSRWTVAYSHELLEMLSDPYMDKKAQFIDRNGNEFTVGYEICDPVKDDRFCYKIGSTLVSDFVLPEYFENSQHPEGTKYDFMGKITKPFEILSGGYLLVQNLGQQHWQQMISDKSKQTAQKAYALRPKVGSREERRTVPRNLWVRSNPYP